MLILTGGQRGVTFFPIPAAELINRVPTCIEAHPGEGRSRIPVIASFAALDMSMGGCDATRRAAALAGVATGAAHCGVLGTTSRTGESAVCHT
jgi:hypothetical protein